MNPIDNIMALADRYAERYHDYQVRASYETAHDMDVFSNALRTAIEQAMGQGDVPEALFKWANAPELVETGNDWQQGYEYARAWVHVQLSCNNVAPQPQPKREHDLKDVRCECCGYMTYHREHMGCIRAAAPHPQPKPLFVDLIAQHPGLSEELAEMQAPNQEPVACKTLCDLCVKRGYESCANVAKTTPIPNAPQPQPKQEPVKLPCCGYYDATAIKWNQLNGVVQCHNCGESYAPQPQREWVGLTDEEVNEWTPEIHDVIRAIEAKLKEKNT
jgi:hypothetical protein